MADVALAFFWHQHQPYYPDDIAGDNPMPWVRLHGVKDYYGMALHLLEVPEMRCTINLVPSLVHQLRGYTERGATDRQLMAMFGWETSQQATTYTASADRKRLAAEAARLMASDQIANASDHMVNAELSHLTVPPEKAVKAK